MDTARRGCIVATTNINKKIDQLAEFVKIVAEAGHQEEIYNDLCKLMQYVLFDYPDDHILYRHYMRIIESDQ